MRCPEFLCLILLCGSPGMGWWPIASLILSDNMRDPSYSPSNEERDQSFSSEVWGGKAVSRRGVAMTSPFIVTSNTEGQKKISRHRRSLQKRKSLLHYPAPLPREKSGFRKENVNAPKPQRLYDSEDEAPRKRYAHKKRGSKRPGDHNGPKPPHTYYQSPKVRPPQPSAIKRLRSSRENDKAEKVLEGENERKARVTREKIILRKSAAEGAQDTKKHLTSKISKVKNTEKPVSEGAKKVKEREDLSKESEPIEEGKTSNNRGGKFSSPEEDTPGYEFNKVFSDIAEMDRKHVPPALEGPTGELPSAESAVVETKIIPAPSDSSLPIMQPQQQQISVISNTNTMSNGVESNRLRDTSSPTWHVAVADKDSNTMYVLRGQRVKVPCTNSTVFVDPVFKWIGPTGKPPVESRLAVSSQGSIIISDAQPKDSGVYQCVVDTDSSPIKPSTSVFKHTLIVFTVPVYSNNIKFAYLVKSCDGQQGLYKTINDAICNLEPCIFTIKIRCTSSQTIYDADQSKQYQFDLTVHQRTPDDFQPNICNSQCMKMQFLSQLRTDAKIVQNFVNSARIPLTYKIGSLKVEPLQECHGGYRMKDDSICVPCWPGSASREGFNVCKPCDLGWYQPDHGMAACFKCPHNGTTPDTGASDVSECKAKDTISVHMKIKKSLMKAILFSVIGFVTVLLTALLIYFVTRYLKNRRRRMSHKGYRESWPYYPNHPPHTVIKDHVPPRSISQERDQNNSAYRHSASPHGNKAFLNPASPGPYDDGTHQGKYNTHQPYDVSTKERRQHHQHHRHNRNHHRRHSSKHRAPAGPALGYLVPVGDYAHRDTPRPPRNLPPPPESPPMIPTPPNLSPPPPLPPPPPPPPPPPLPSSSHYAGAHGRQYQNYNESNMVQYPPASPYPAHKSHIDPAAHNKYSRQYTSHQNSSHNRHGRHGEEKRSTERRSSNQNVNNLYTTEKQKESYSTHRSPRYNSRDPRTKSSTPPGHARNHSKSHSSKPTEEPRSNPHRSSRMKRHATDTDTEIVGNYKQQRVREITAAFDARKLKAQTSSSDTSEHHRREYRRRKKSSKHNTPKVQPSGDIGGRFFSPPSSTSNHNGFGEPQGSVNTMEPLYNANNSHHRQDEVQDYPISPPKETTSSLTDTRQDVANRIIGTGMALPALIGNPESLACNIVTDYGYSLERYVATPEPRYLAARNLTAVYSVNSDMSADVKDKYNVRKNKSSYGQPKLDANRSLNGTSTVPRSQENFNNDNNRIHVVPLESYRHRSAHKSIKEPKSGTQAHGHTQLPKQMTYQDSTNLYSQPVDCLEQDTPVTFSPLIPRMSCATYLHTSKGVTFSPSAYATTGGESGTGYGSGTDTQAGAVNAPINPYPLHNMSNEYPTYSSDYDTSMSSHFVSQRAKMTYNVT